MTEDTPTRVREPRQPRRWPKVLLAASLTLNVLVLSVIAGAYVRDHRDHRVDRRSPPPERSVLREGGLMPFYDAMPRDARRKMAEAFRASERGFGPDRAALAADFRNFVGALRAEPFEAERLEKLLEAQQARAQARVSAGREILIAQIAGMSPEERAEFADVLEELFRDALTRAPRPQDKGPNGGR